MNTSPINLSFDTATFVGERALVWCNYRNPPKLMKLTNTGKTVMLSGKWYQERPHVKEGPLANAYIFSQIHFHWGSTDLDGSEHGIEGKKMAMEMHMVHFNAKYKSLQEAKNKTDGIAIAAFFFQINDTPNVFLNQMISQLPLVNNAFTSVNIEPFPLTSLNLELFVTNYFLYCGTVGRESNPHTIAWLVYPKPIPISRAQVAKFRDLKASNNDLIISNCHEMQNILHPNGVFFLDQVIDQDHRKESSLFCLPSLRHITKFPSFKMREKNLHQLDLERGTHEIDASNTEFLQRVEELSCMNSFQQNLKIQPQNNGEIIATLGLKNQNKVEIALKNQKKWNEDPCQEDESGKEKVTHHQSILKRQEGNGKKLDSADYDSETYLGNAIGSTTFRSSSKQECTATSYHQNAIHNTSERINVVDFQHSDISLQETRGSTMIRIDSDTQQCRS